jgi:hypothetical protein
MLIRKYDRLKKERKIKHTASENSAQETQTQQERKEEKEKKLNKTTDNKEQNKRDLRLGAADNFALSRQVIQEKFFLNS